MKNPRTCEEMLAMANKYTLAKEVAGDTGRRPNKVSSDLTMHIGLWLYELITSLLSQMMFSQGNEAYTRDEGHGGPKPMERGGHRLYQSTHQRQKSHFHRRPKTRRRHAMRHVTTDDCPRTKLFVNYE
jgi:hypothetical protein